MDYVNITVVIYILTLFNNNVIAVCQEPKIIGTIYQKDVEGVYELFGTCFNKPSYRIQSRDSLGRHHYLFYYGAYDEWNGWMVAPYSCMNQQPDLRVMDGSSEPILITSTWEERYMSTNNYNLNTKVKCLCDDGLTAGVVIGISVSAVLAVSVLLFCGLVYTNAYSRKRRRMRNNTNITEISSHAFRIPPDRINTPDICIYPATITLPPYTPPGGVNIVTTNSRSDRKLCHHVNDISPSLPHNSHRKEECNCASPNSLNILPPSYDQVLSQKRKEMDVNTLEPS